MKKLTEKEVRDYLKEHGGWNLLSTYDGIHDNIVIEKDGYKTITCLASFRNNANAIIFGVRNPFYKENIMLLINRLNSKVVFVDARGVKKSGKHRIVVDMIDENGHSFSKTIEHILNPNERLCCKVCSRKEQTENHREKFTKKWIDKINYEKYKLIDNPEFITADTVIDVEEIETGYRFTANIRSVVKGTLQAFNVFSNRKYFLYNLKIYGIKNGLQSTPLRIGDITSSHNKVVFKCNCGNTFERSIYKWMDGRDLCINCSQVQSSYERLFEEYLIDKKYKYKKEYRFNDCRDEKPLPFDFYITSFDCLVEIDGQQHFEPTKFDGDINTANKKFLLQKKHDNIKNNYCKNKNIPLLRLPYFCFEDGTWIDKFNHFIKTVKD